MKIVGIDPSLNATGYACPRGPYKEMTTISVKGKGEARLNAIVNGLLYRIPDASLVVIEGLSFGARSTSAHELAGLHWMLRADMYRLGFPFLVVAPTLLKKFATGKGNAKKEVVMMDVSRRWGIRPEDSNQADAYVLARIGLCYAGHDEPKTKHQIEVMATLAGKAIARENV